MSKSQAMSPRCITSETYSHRRVSSASHQRDVVFSFDFSTRANQPAAISIGLWLIPDTRPHSQRHERSAKRLREIRRGVL